MKLKQLTEKLLDKWFIKLLCLAIAIGLYVFHQVSAIEKRSFVVPLTMIENGSVTHVDGKKKSVTVTIRANADQITQVHSSDISASVNLDALPKSGEYSVPVNIDINPDLLLNNPFEIKVSPEYVKVQVEKKSVAYIKVSPSIVGECLYGYEVTKVQVEPEYVEVIGPESLLQNTAEIKTEMIEVDNARSSFTINVNCKEISNAIDIKNKGPYAVTVEIDAIELQKDFEKVPVDLKGLNANLSLKGTAPEITLKLEGNMASLETYEIPKNAIYVDVSTIHEPGTYELPVLISLPSYYKVLEKSVENVSVTLEEVSLSSAVYDANANMILE